MSVLVCNIREHANACEGMRDLFSCVEALAQADETLNDVGIYQSTRQRGGIQKKNILGSDGYFASGLRKSDFDYVLVHPLPQDGNASTPVCYTRGFLPNGQWTKDGLYGSEGGLIAFAGGDVVSVRNAKSVLISPETEQPIENIAETFPKGAVPVRYFSAREIMVRKPKLPKHGLFK